MTWATVAVPDSAPVDSPANHSAPVAEQPSPPAAAQPSAQSARQPAPQPASQPAQPAPPRAPSRPVSLDGNPPDFEPVEEADREPEPEYEPDYSSPIVGTRPPQGRPGAQQQPAESARPAQHTPQPDASAAPARPIARKATIDKARYGESVVREILGASFIEEQAVAPRVTPRID